MALSALGAAGGGAIVGVGVGVGVAVGVGVGGTVGIGVGVDVAVGVGVGVNVAVAVSAERVNGIAILDTKTSEVMPPIPGGNRAWSIALDSTGSKLYTANGASGDVSSLWMQNRTKELCRVKGDYGPFGNCDRFPGMHGLGAHNSLITRRRNWDSARATRATADRLPRCCRPADMRAQLCRGPAE